MGKSNIAYKQMECNKHQYQLFQWKIYICLWVLTVRKCPVHNMTMKINDSDDTNRGN